MMAVLTVGIICLSSKWNGENRMLHTHLTLDQDYIIKKEDFGQVEDIYCKEIQWR